jgi:carbon starvation protein CstA
MDDAGDYDRAKRRVRQIKGFYIHATVFVLVNALLLIINMTGSRGEIWFVWPLFGWGIGLAAHGIAVFGLGGLWGPEWEERKIKEMVEKNRSR